ncbi:MAG: alpha/beta hydrolase [Bdellovibrionales bacterium]|nr:alpha/beta hydrolase [Bdellovibrionales bacterium]
MVEVGKKKSLISECIFTLRLLLACFALLILIFGLTVSLSWSAWLLLGGQFLFAVSIIAPWSGPRRTARSLAGVAGVLMLAGSFIVVARQGVVNPRPGEVYSLGSESPLPFGELIEERDIVFLATRILPFMGGLTFKESAGLLPSIVALYSSMDSQRGSFSSPLTHSLIGFPYVGNSPVLSFDPVQSHSSNRAIVFLHGVGGNWSLMCWLVAEAAESIGASTHCPSLGILGTWGANRGRAILSELLDSLKSQGKSEVYLVAMSAGAVGAGQLARDFEKQLHGVALLNGSHPAIRDVDLPLFLLWSSDDERFPANLLAWIAKGAAERNPHVTRAEVAGGHLFPVKQKDEFLKLLKSWLRSVADEEPHET